MGVRPQERHVDINGKLWDPDIDHSPEFLANPPDKVRRNTAEIWTFRSTSGGWDHPIHVHFEEGLIMSQNGVPVADANRYRTDIYRMGGTQRVDEMEVFMRFRDFPDPDYGQQVEQTSGRLRHALPQHAARGPRDDGDLEHRALARPSPPRRGHPTTSWDLRPAGCRAEDTRALRRPLTCFAICFSAAAAVALAVVAAPARAQLAPGDVEIEGPMSAQ